MTRGQQNRNTDKGLKPPFTNEQWIALLRDPANEKAVEELRRLLVHGLKPALYKYVDQELDQFVEDVTQDGILKILSNLDSFRGESKFMTWAMKIAVREGLTELRRKRWDNVSIEAFKGSGGESGEVRSNNFSTEELSPESSTAQKMAVAKVEQMIDELLTERQRTALKALLIEGLPSFMVAKQMNTNRNNLYKLLYDARKKLKNELKIQGIDPDEMLHQLSEL